jgi:hypothetical protein
MRRVHSLFEIQFPAERKVVLHLSFSNNFLFLKVIQYPLMTFTSEIFSWGSLKFSSVFGNRLSRKSNNVLLYPFAFHIAVQQPFQPVWSRLLPYDHELSPASLALCDKSLQILLLSPSKMFVPNFLIIKPTRCTNYSNVFWEWNSTCFGHFLCPSSGVIHCTLSNGICHEGL